jgi:5-methyltetrahydrofolate--homocysteine methyltransferase
VSDRSTKIRDWRFRYRIRSLGVCPESGRLVARDELGFGAEDGDLDRMPRDHAYRGSRYSFGPPACPNLEDRAKLVELLKPERIGVHLSEELQLHPEQSTDALVVHHPEAKYFNAS